MTKQELFNKVVTHLLTQKQPARKTGRDNVRPGVKCMYRNADGLKCAVGCLIPDDRYDKNYEGKSADYLVKAGSFTDVGITTANATLLEDLQYMHDEVHPEFWESRLAELAVKHELEIPS